MIKLCVVHRESVVSEEEECEVRSEEIRRVINRRKMSRLRYKGGKMGSRTR